jgi:hypothetical protein
MADDPIIRGAAYERTATQKEMEAAILMFEAAVWRSDTVRLNLATEAAHAAMQAHLDSIAGLFGVLVRAADRNP